jgi:aspartate/tyrosine/aromatic aminotransferase
MSFFGSVPLLPEDPILSLPSAFAADERPFKVNVGVGSYKTAEGLPLLLTAVRKAEQLILQKQTNKEYLSIEGDAEFLKFSMELLFGSTPIQHAFAAQTVGGSGALRIGGEFLARLITKTIFIPQPTWQNHKQIFEKALLQVESYPYYDFQKHTIDFTGMCEAIAKMPKKSAIVLHACCHNPTGMDPSIEQWRMLSKLIQQQQLIPFFDVAYQGFGNALDQDVEAVRLFAQEGHEMLIAYSFAKNMGLYGERAGFFTILTSNPEATFKSASQIRMFIRGNYSSPPLHAARIVTTILKNSELRLEWEDELKNMRDRINEMHQAFVATLLVKSKHIDFSYMRKQQGLFSFCGLTTEQVRRLKEEWAIYMPTNGRLNVAGLTTNNMEYVAESIAAVID